MANISALLRTPPFRGGRDRQGLLSVSGEGDPDATSCGSNAEHGVPSQERVYSRSNISIEDGQLRFRASRIIGYFSFGGYCLNSFSTDFWTCFSSPLWAFEMLSSVA